MILNKKIEAPSQMTLPPASAPQQLADEAASDPPSPEGPPEDGMELEAEVERSEPLTFSARSGSKMSTESEDSYASSLCGSGRTSWGRGLRIG